MHGFVELRKTSKAPSVKAAGDTDEYDDDFDEPDAPPAASAPAPFPELSTSDFEQSDLNDLSTVLQSCIDVILHVWNRGACLYCLNSVLMVCGLPVLAECNHHECISHEK